MQVAAFVVAVLLAFMANAQTCIYTKAPLLGSSPCGQPITSDTPHGKVLGVQPESPISMRLTYGSGVAYNGCAVISRYQAADTVRCPFSRYWIEYKACP